MKGGVIVNVKTQLKRDLQFGRKLELKPCLKSSFKLRIIFFFQRGLMERSVIDRGCCLFAMKLDRFCLVLPSLRPT